MNYRHAFHAGSPADVVKHAVLARILVHLRDKPAAFRVIDTHAGAGLYDLRGPEASRSPEWRDGIARLLAAPIDGAARALLAPYLDVVARPQCRRRARRLSGLARAGARLPALQDRLIACELEPNAAAALTRNLGRDRRVKTIAIDGWIALKAYVPPPERRGVVLIDPPFEAADDFPPGAGARSRASQMGDRHLPALVSDQGPAGAGRAGAALAALGDPESPARRGRLRAAREPERRGGCGLIVVNPPWTLADELEILLPALAKVFAGGHRVDWIGARRITAA